MHALKVFGYMVSILSIVYDYYINYVLCILSAVEIVVIDFHI